MLKAALSLPLSAAGSQLSNLVVHPYQLSRLPPPSPEECRMCDPAVLLCLSPTPSPGESIGSLQLNSRNRQMFQDAKFLQEVDLVHSGHWVIHREETVKCHPAAQGAASASLSL